MRKFELSAIVTTAVVATTIPLAATQAVASPALGSPVQPVVSNTQSQLPAVGIANQSEAPTEVRGDVSGSRTTTKLTVATPVRGQASIVSMKVRSRSTPTVRVSRAGSKTGTRKVTAISGVKRVSSQRAGTSTYRVTVPIIKPRVKGSKETKGRLKIAVSGAGLLSLSSQTSTRTRTKRVKQGFCSSVRGKYLNIKSAKDKLGFRDSPAFGPRLAGFRDSGYVGVFTVSQACRSQSPQSFLNRLTGRSTAAVQRSAPRTRAAINPAPGSGNAVVLVSGFMSQTPFTTPGNLCSASGMSSGGTWSVMQTALATAGFPVFTAPETTYDYSTPSSPTPVAITPSTMGLGTCGAAQLPGSMTLNTAGDFDLNSNILANFLEYLNTNYGISQVWLVGHSDGGLWSRGAMDYASYMSGVTVNSVTTIDTPYTGSFLANTAQDQTNGCGFLNPSCDALEAILNYFSSSLAQGAALDEMTSSYMIQWNSRMANVAGNTPFYAASAIGLNDPDAFDTLSSGTGTQPFYNPNDVAVGIASQQGQGLVENGTIASLTCFPTIPGLHTQVPSDLISTGQDIDLINTFPGRDASPNSTTPVTTNPMNITNVTNVLNGTPPTGACPSANYTQSGEYMQSGNVISGSWPDD